MGSEGEPKPFSSSGNWDITREAFLPHDITRKVNRAWDRVPVVAQAPRLHGSTVWKKVATRKYGTSKDIEAEVLREADANGSGARKRIRGEGKRDCIQDATWVNTSDRFIPNLESSLETSFNSTSFDFEDTKVVVEEDKGTFPAIHFVPRKRTHNDQIITPKKVESLKETELTEEAQRLLNSVVVHEAEEKPARRRKSARMSMANRRVTLGGPSLGLNSPLKSTPSKISPTVFKGRPVKIFESGGGGSGGTPKVFGSNTLARNTRRTTLGGTNELLTPSKAPEPRKLRTLVSLGRKSLSALRDTKALGLDGERDQKSTAMNASKEQNAKRNIYEELHAGNTNQSPKRRRISSIQPPARKSSRLSSSSSRIEEPSQIKSGRRVSSGINAQVAPETSVPSNYSSEDKDEDMLKTNDPGTGTDAIRPTEAPDIFGTSKSSNEESDDSEISERPTYEHERPRTRRSSREFIRETENSISKVNILMSIKSIHMAKISSGIKTHEFRGYKLPEATEYLWLYETAPKQCITHVAKIGPAKSPGEIHEKGLNNREFNAKGDMSQYAYEVLQLYELKDELPLHTILEKQYAKGPPQKYSFASQKMLNDISLFDDATLLLDRTLQTLTKPSEETISLPQLSNGAESVDIFSLNAATASAMNSDENGEVSTIADEFSIIPTRLDCIEEEATPEENALDLQASLRLRSPPPVYDDMLNVGGENSATLLSPVKGEENKLAELSPIQLGNKLLEEEAIIVSSPAEDSRSPSSSDENSTGSSDDNANPNSFMSPPHEDTIMLKDFVTRVKANKAASVKDAAKTTGEQLHSPMRLPLGYKDSNLSPLPQEASPSKTMCLSAMPIETPSVPKSKKAGKRPNPLSSPYEEGPTIRRSARTRTPTKTGVNSSLPLPISAPSSIPLRRLGVNDGNSDAELAIKKADRQLAALTKINTTKNAGPLDVPAFLARQALDANASGATVLQKLSKKKSPTSATTAIEESVEDESLVVAVRDKGRSTGRKNVMWAEELLQYQDAPSLEERSISLLSEVKKPVKVGMRSTTASKIAIGMGISGPSASNLIPESALNNHGAQAGKSLVPAAVGSGSTSSSVASGAGKTDVNASAKKNKKSLPVPKKEKVAEKSTMAAISSAVSVMGSAESRIGTPSSRSKAAKSRIALGRGVNGTPAPKRKVKGKA